MKIAILIGSHLEHIDKISNLLNNLLIDNLEYDTFIYTNKRYQKYIKYFKNVKKYAFIENNKNDMNEELKIKKLEAPSNIFQYFNLKRCFSLLESYRLENNINYDCVIRLRPDICKSTYKLFSPDRKNFLWTMKTDINRPYWRPKNIEENVVYAKTDQFYMGNYETMKKISKIYDYIYNYYGIEENKKYWNLNYENIAKSDMNSVRFDMLVYPNIINQESIDSFTDSGKLSHLKFDDFNALELNSKWEKYYNLKNILKNDIKNKLPLLTKYKYKKGDILLTGKCGSINRNFRAEKFFSFYTTSLQNLIVKDFKYIRNSG